MDNKKLVISAAIAAVFASGAAMAEPKQGGTLTVPAITPAFIENFNPFSNPNKENPLGELFEPMLTYNSMTGNIDFRLAEKFEYNEDLTEITYTLREGLKWSDGSALTAEDVAFSAKLGKVEAALDGKALWKTGKLVDVVALNDREVKFVLGGVDTSVEWHIADIIIVPEHEWSKVPADKLLEHPNLNPVGSGPLTTVSYVKPQQMEMCRNPHYYLEGRPYLDCIRYRAYNDNSQIQPALMNGDIDWGSNFIADIDKTFVKANPDHHKYWYPANDAIHIYMNTKQAPFNDIEFRQAFSMAVDREAIVDLAAYGYPTVNTNPGGLGDYFKTYWSEEVLEKYGHLTQYQPERAVKMLDKAGYTDKDGDGFRDLPDGSPLNFKIDVVAGWTDWVQSVQMVTEYLQEIGINAEMNPVDWGAYDKALKEGTYQASINWSLTNNINPIQAYLEYFHTDRIGQLWHSQHGIHDEKIDNLIDSFGKSADPAYQQDILNQLQMFTAEQLPFISLFSNPIWYQYNDEKIAGWPSADNAFVHPVFYDHAHRKMQVFNELHLR